MRVGFLKALLYLLESDMAEIRMSITPRTNVDSYKSSQSSCLEALARVTDGSFTRLSTQSESKIRRQRERSERAPTKVPCNTQPPD